MNFICMGSLCVCFFLNFYDLLANFVHFLRISWRTLVEFICVYMYIFCISAPFPSAYHLVVFVFWVFIFLFLFLFCCFWGGIFTCISFIKGWTGWWAVEGGVWSWLELNCFIFWIFDIWRVYNVYIIIVIIVFCGSLTGHRSLLIDSYIVWCLM